MARSPSSAFLRRKSEPISTPLEIWDIHLGSTTVVDSSTLFFVKTNKNIRFYSFVDSTPRIYLGIGVGRSAISRHIDSKIDNVEISLDNVDRTFSQYFNDIDLRGKRIIIRKVFADYLAASSDQDGDNFIVMFDGVMDTPTLIQSRLSAQARNNFFSSLAFHMPRRTYQGMCSWKFGHSGDCAGHRTQAQLFDTKIGQTVDSILGQTHIIDAARTEGGSGDYWAPGIVIMTAGTSGNIGLKRRIIQSTHSGDLFLESQFPYQIAAGDEYTIQRDCGHVLGKDCTDRFLNNSEYGGFVTIPDNLVRRS